MAQTIIESGKTEKNYWKDLWRFRELFYILSWRDIKVRYKQTILGAAWAVIRPLLTTIVFAIIFGRVAKFDQEITVPYVLFVYAAMLPWQFFANALSEASNSLVGNANLITKVYFPRLIVPASSVITSLVDYFISLGILIVLFFYYGFMPDWKIALLPLFTILVFFASFGIGLYITALNVKYRDFRYIIPFIIQFGMYVSPVGFSSAKIPVAYRDVFYINPMAGVIDGFRYCIVGEQMYWRGFLISSVMIVLFMILGVWYFRRTEKTFADNI